MSKTRPTTTANNNEAQTMTGTSPSRAGSRAAFLNPSPLAGRVGAKRRGGVSKRVKQVRYGYRPHPAGFAGHPPPHAGEGSRVSNGR